MAKDPQTEKMVFCDDCGGVGMTEWPVEIYNEEGERTKMIGIYEELPEDLKSEYECKKCEGTGEIEIDQLGRTWPF